MHKKQLFTGGESLDIAEKILIMVHGRGGNASDILTLADYFDLEGFTFLAPQATNDTWYPFSFMVPPKQNEPWLGSALSLLKDVVSDLNAKGFKNEKIYFLGFSQGACLTLEFITRNATKYGGVIAFTGGLIGDSINKDNYKGDFEGTKIFLSSGDTDPHVPIERVNATEEILKEMNAQVTKMIYKNRPHTITSDELLKAREFVFSFTT
jgi:phospholipase/carboxylesterase